MTEISAGQWKHTNLSAGDGLLATYDGNGLHYHLADRLGTNRVQTDRHGNIEETCTNQPFGDNQQCSGSSLEATEQHFTGKERDTESGLDFFGARYYAGGMGRFMNPDWADKPEAVPYATLTNPQTLNLYAYVGNSPIGRADRDGHIYNGSTDSGTDPDSGWYEEAVQRDAKLKKDQDEEEAEQAAQPQQGQQQPPPAPPPANVDPVVTPIAVQARKAAIDILSGNNGCSQYFDTGAVDFSSGQPASAAQIFSATEIRSNPESPGVGARSTEGSGSEGAIWVNPNGPFSHAMGIVDFKVRTLDVAPGVAGGTLKSQVLILLHEFAHKIFLIPRDGGNQALSNHNTEVILNHCGPELRR